ncbi:DUF1552 domain-containing protein [Thalassomonas sp. M1454]|uniref:DUF1552 domain-containing protein n=1 Tax=Thalassomonas sp. M1454 TaxID=2594477 RepID=UPI00117D3185|nr:DUF1552 domain-containing protein [Thalassomonas sp. M1454]TRX58018.1 DUF1552 domain-containing protein [Thalassomonas sp. M1454]
MTIKNISRRSFLKSSMGLALALPCLEIMGAKAVENSAAARRFCALYTANGMSFPLAKHNLPQWSWYPQQLGANYEFGESTKPLAPHRNDITFLGGLEHPNAAKSDPHICSDMWLTGAPLHDPRPGGYNTVSIDQIIAQHTKQFCRVPSLVMSIDAGVGYQSRTSTLSYNMAGNPIPAENNPRHIFNRLFLSNDDSQQQQRELLRSKTKVVDAVLENSRKFNQSLGQVDKAKMDLYLTSLSEIEDRLITSEKWLDIPLKKQDYSNLNFDYDLEKNPADFYQVMFDIIALAFDADITRSVSFLLNREDGMGISDTFPQRIGLRGGHHGLSHAKDKNGQLNFAKYDKFLSTQVAYFLDKLASYKDGSQRLLDNSIVMYGSGCSETHVTNNLPLLLAGGANMGLQHGRHIRAEKEALSNIYLSILKSMKIPESSFADSHKAFEQGLFKFS